MGKLTDRGEIVAAGGAALAAQDGDDTLTPAPDQSTGSDAAAAAERTGETERQDQDADAAPDAADAPGPADIPPPPVVETADADQAGKETRTP